MLSEVKRLCKNDFADLGREKIINEEKYKSGFYLVLQGQQLIQNNYFNLLIFIDFE